MPNRRLDELSAGDTKSIIEEAGIISQVNIHHLKAQNLRMLLQQCLFDSRQHKFRSIGKDEIVAGSVLRKTIGKLDDEAQSFMNNLAGEPLGKNRLTYAVINSMFRETKPKKKKASEPRHGF